MWKKLFGAGADSREEAACADELELDPQRIPAHIAVIMDGNGRWAQSKGLLRTLGHKAGGQALKRIVTEANRLGVKAMTIYAFSTENWKRPHDEVDFLMNLFSEYLDNEIDALNRDNIRLQFIGRTEELSEGLQARIENARQRTKQNTGLILNAALNYGSRDEIVRAVKIIAQRVYDGQLCVDDITEETIEQNLYTWGLPPLDLVIRPSGDLRISNFLLWQSAYAEFWFTEVNWPDFEPHHLRQAILDYQKRDRRFGGLNKK